MGVTGKIVSIKRFAIYDGPGIRTTVFLKGCSLHCRWCHNPECIALDPEIGVIAGKCVRCGECAAVCPEQALSHSDSGLVRLDRMRCSCCGACIANCSYGALEWYGRDLPEEEVAAVILEDKLFYRTSGGGATISGGEPLLQTDFCFQLLSRLKQSGIHCAIDTCGCVNWDAIAKVLPVTDLFLYDLKHIDSEKHRDATGAPNELILENLRRLSKESKLVEIRMPVVPGINDADRDIIGVGDFLAGLSNIAAVRLLPYHAAHSKFEAIGRTDTMLETAAPFPEKLEHIADLLRKCGIHQVII
ncbi:MAG: glycyl-radical enzyme activating protein [Candidatus Pacebacteria bacterium]|nr:glycyl-radical enzyme activating protein [Candidatus Paceibacterota bacterium]